MPILNTKHGDSAGRVSPSRRSSGSGPRAALPHGQPSDVRIGESPFVLIDWGAVEGLYMSDLTRVLVTGRLPAKLAKDLRRCVESTSAGDQGDPSRNDLQGG